MDKNSRLKNFPLYFICTLVTFFSQMAHAVEQTTHAIELSALANLAEAALKNDKWHTVLPVLGNQNQYFIATQAGRIYQLHNSDIIQPAFFDLKSALKNSDIIALTAITLDPNFNYRDRDGYHTFYTAHTEASQKTKRKLAPKNAELNVPYDTVIMRWQLNYSPEQAPKVMLQREVLRIAIQQISEHIQQLSFNPYLEPWHDDYGLLFITLAQSKTLKSQALYAGAILRIKPKKYGLQSYTIPANNPFAKTANIRNEIVFIAGHQIEHFDWIKKSTYSLLVQLNYQDTNVLTQAKLGDDWREAVPQAQIKKRLSPVNTKGNILLYHGRELKNLWGKALYLEETENVWRLQVSALSSNINDDESSQSTPLNFSNYDTNKQAKFSLHQKHDGELLLLEHSQQQLYALKTPETNMIAAPIMTQPIKTSNNNSVIAAIFFMVLILMSYFWYLRKNTTNKQHFLHQQWANFDVDPASQSLSLYKRHVQAAEQVISISSLTRSELWLNDEVISTVSADSTQAFSNDVEDKVLTVFAKEHRLKMIDEKQRKIQLCLTDDQNNRYLFCLYFRVGNIRHTKLKYQQVINQVIDWHWLFSQYINPNVTIKRKIKVKLKREKTATSVLVPATVSEPLAGDILEDNSTEITSTTDIDTDKATSLKNKRQRSDDDSADLDTKLVSALDKLVLMKKQGYLDENEFNIAKTKILRDLTNN
tara:strand:+ start:3849 stop:5963 length:2115 start_codon:yes stop_codon:yes gene_type:complete